MSHCIFDTRFHLVKQVESAAMLVDLPILFISRTRKGHFSDHAYAEGQEEAANTVSMHDDMSALIQAYLWIVLRRRA